LKPIPFILYGGDTCQDGTQLGIESLRRTKTALRFIRENRFRIDYMLIGPGINPDEPDYPLLKLVMYRYLKKFPVLPPIIIVEEDAWGTFKETLVLYTELASCNENEVFICSSWYHIPRIRFIWWIIAEDKIKIHVVKAPSPQWKSVLREIPAFIKVFYDWYKWKRTP